MGSCGKQVDREEATDPLGLASVTKGPAEEAILVRLKKSILFWFVFLFFLFFFYSLI